MIPLIDSMTSPTSLPSSSPAMAIRRNDPLVSPSPAAVASAPAAAAAARPTSGLGGARRPDAIRPPPPQLPLPLGPPSSSSLYSLTYDTASSPPPYYSVINSDRMAGGENNTPNTGGSYDANYRFGGGGQPSQAQQPQSPPAANTEFLPQGHGAHGSQTQSMILGPRAQRRARPPLPAGPRRPTQLAAIIATRERNGSVSSVNSQQLSSLPSGSTSSTSNRPPPPPHPPSQQRQVSAPLPPPQFTTPTPKWRGYTMEAAKWTFTSMQLQEIVSRAIRQSSEPSGIRLLQLETLDNEILPELERLESLRTEMIKRYQALTRKRGNLLDVMLSGVDGMDPDVAFKQLEELKEICGSLDTATEELHRVDEQIAQIAQLIQGHSSSALAMALRKLNASFLKQFAEAQGLRQQVEAIQAERDEAWKQAEALAVEFEELKSGKIESPDAENRFEKVMAVRKSSTRATKAGLRSANSLRSNQRASTGSATRLGAGTPSSARTTYADDLPPVPPIPRRRPEDIKTNLPLRNSTITGGGSGEFSTPNSDTRAMVRAQEELYDMLGIPMNERSRRSRSVILPGDSEPQLVASPSYISYFEPPPNTGRRASLPPSAPLPPDPLSLANVWTSDRSGWI
ncbi:hypothetical protein H0H93_016058 [Arthromyces matolae]|nr:hypothetical protein H0H93_016058 [Arthromyces matolae]